MHLYQQLLNTMESHTYYMARTKLPSLGTQQVTQETVSFHVLVCPGERKKKQSKPRDAYRNSENDNHVQLKVVY